MVKAAVKQKKISASASPRPERTAEEELPVDTREPSSESDLEEEEEEDDESMGVEKPMVQNGAGIGKGKISMEQLRKMREGRQKKGAMAKRLGLSIPPRLIQKTMMKAKYAERVPMKAAVSEEIQSQIFFSDLHDIRARAVGGRRFNNGNGSRKRPKERLGFGTPYNGGSSLR